jgi:hypothetical protein
MYSQLAACWTVRESNPGKNEIFHTHSVWPWGPPSLLYSAHQVSCSVVKQSGRGVDHTPPLRAEVKGGIELNLWPVLG